MNNLSIQNLHFSYDGKIQILRDIDLTLDGRPTAIIGQNGAGKTTLVKLMKGLLRPDSGKIFYGEEDIADRSVASLAGDIGLIFQNPNDQIFKNTVIDEIMFGPLQIGMDKIQAQASAQKALELVGLQAVADENPYDLGLSDRKLVSIASILAMNPQVIIFDEPTIAQDFGGKERIKAIIHSLSQEGKQVVSILHDMDFVAETFGRVIVMAGGKILLDGHPKEVFAQQKLLEDSFLEQPNVTRLWGEIQGEGTPLTTEEFVDWYQK